MTTPPVFVMEITEDMVGRHLLIQGQSMFADEAFKNFGAGTAQAAPAQNGPAYEIPPGMSPIDAMADWVVRFINDAPGKKATITELRDALPEQLIGLYQNVGSARGAVAKAVQKGIDAETLVATGTGSQDVVRKAPRKKKVKAEGQADDRGQTQAKPQDQAQPQDQDSGEDQNGTGEQADDKNTEQRVEQAAPAAPEAASNVLSPKGETLSSTRPVLSNDVADLDGFTTENGDNNGPII